MKKFLLMLAAFIGCAACELPQAEAQISIGFGTPVYNGYTYGGYGYGYPAYSTYVAPYPGYVVRPVAPVYRAPYYGYGYGYGYRPAYVGGYRAYGYRRW